jgi:hypothetical protein
MGDPHDLALRERRDAPLFADNAKRGEDLGLRHAAPAHRSGEANERRVPPTFRDHFTVCSIVALAVPVLEQHAKRLGQWCQGHLIRRTPWLPPVRSAACMPAWRGDHGAAIAAQIKAWRDTSARPYRKVWIEVVEVATSAARQHLRGDTELEFLQALMPSVTGISV